MRLILRPLGHEHRFLSHLPHSFPYGDGYFPCRNGQLLAIPMSIAKKYECVFSALEVSRHPRYLSKVMTKGESFMKQLALAAAVLALLSVAANAQYGKGKAPPPPPVVTKG